jgi:hypothetical protein
MHLIDHFSSKFLWLSYNPPIDMIGRFNTWNPEVQSPPTTRIQVPPALVISFKSTFIQFECWRLLYDKFFFILRIRRIEKVDIRVHLGRDFKIILTIPHISTDRTLVVYDMRTICNYNDAIYSYV